MIKQIKFRFFMRIKYLFHLVLFYVYKFDSWHISSIESRQYCLDVVHYINSTIKSDETVVEIGCGLGETIASIHCFSKYGYDQSHQVIRAAKFINRNKYIANFKVGSFDSPVGLEIKYLITLNFLHDFRAEEVIEWFKLIIKNNNVLNIIVDELDHDQYFRLHKYDSLIPNDYEEVKTIQNNYTFGRSIKVFSIK
jgi:hypothetical protein